MPFSCTATHRELNIHRFLAYLQRVINAGAKGGESKNNQKWISGFRAALFKGFFEINRMPTAGHMSKTLLDVAKDVPGTWHVAKVNPWTAKVLEVGGKNTIGMLAETECEGAHHTTN